MVHILVIDDEEDIRLHAHFEVSIALARRQRAVENVNAADIARNTPDVDAAKVQQLKEQIQNGTYRVDSGRVADAMLQEAVQNDRAADSRLRQRSSYRACQLSKI